MLLLCVWALASWFLVPHGIGTSWRECDTQAIARNFVLDGFEPLRPRVDWRGLTDGAVECEFPLYELAIAGVLKVAGDVEWPGRLLSLLSMVVGAAALHRLLERRAGPAGAFAGLCVFLVSGSAVMLGVRVMPDATSFAFGMVALLCYERWLCSGANSALVAATALMAVSGLQKPLSLQLGIVMFGMVCVQAPHRLREGRTWLSYLAILGTVGWWLAHGAAIHAETGLSFGVVSGGDSKFPDFAHLVDPRAQVRMLATSATFGFTVFGWIGLVVAIVCRRWRGRDTWFLVAAGLGLLVSFRYSHDHGLGPHYHIFAAAAGAICVAMAWPRTVPRWAWLLLLGTTALHGAWRLRDERGVRIVVNQSPIMAAAAVAAASSQPGELLIVRSDKPRRDVSWGRGNNFEDPRLFYQARRRGFVLPVEEFTSSRLERLVRRGGVLVFDPLPATTPAEVTAWLAANGRILFEGGEVRLWRMQAPN